jgi:coiled-coil domain-containing protein 12
VEPARAPTAAELPDALQAAKGEEEPSQEEDAVVGVAPKKANWDLRRDVEQKLAKLERRTQRAMVELMKVEEQRALEADGGIADASE